MTKPEFFLVFPRAWRMGLSNVNIRAGFAMTGLWPYNREAISEDNFEAAEELCKIEICALSCFSVVFVPTNPDVRLFDRCVVL